MSDRYQEFLARESQFGCSSGFAPGSVPEQLFDFQKSLLEWSLRQGRAAIFADCGLGKTPMQLAWADNVVRKTNRPALVLTPLAVSAQTIREAEKFGIEARRGDRGGRLSGIAVTNYERLHHLDPAEFAGVVCDESSILKSFDGVRRQQITEFMRRMPYRLLCTATAAPNDYFELGTSSEALGHLGHVDMLHRFFRNDQGKGAAAKRSFGQAVQWRLRGHAEEAFWRWVCSWARAIRKPSDLGFDDAQFVLPPLMEAEHVVRARTRPPGMLFDLPAESLQEQRDEQRRTLQERCERVADLVAHDRPALVWCQLNDEGNLLQRLIPDAVQVSGADADEVKEERFLAFASGQARVLITKPKIGAWGLNFQHCAHVTFFPSHSFEQFYQGVRRCWRFGQANPVRVDVVTSEGGAGMLANLQRKARQAEAMFARLVELMSNAQSVRNDYRGVVSAEVPAWL